MRKTPLREIGLHNLEILRQLELRALQVVRGIRSDIVRLIRREVLGAAGGGVLVRVVGVVGLSGGGAGHGAFRTRGLGRT